MGDHFNELLDQFGSKTGTVYIMRTEFPFR